MSNTSNANSSNFSMPDADLLAASRKQEHEENLLIDDLLQEQEDINKSEITFCLEALQIEKLSLAIPGENPGIDIAELSIDKLLDAPSKFRSQFIRIFVKTVEESDGEEHLRIILDHVSGILFNFAIYISWAHNEKWLNQDLCLLAD